MAKKQFKAESKRLLDLMINSIYTNKEIFLREIISNASDAIDKLCYLSLTDENVGMSRDDFKIRVELDKENRTITVIDNGIGMDKAEAENNLGIIAKSGSNQFKQDLDTEEDAAEDVSIIGQFGVGFYSAFMVSQKVTVETKKYGEEMGVKWESSGVDGYTVKEIEKPEVGTRVIMHLKEDTDEEVFSSYLEVWKIKALIKKYSDYVRWPIEMDVEHQERKETGEVDDQGNPTWFPSGSAPKRKSVMRTVLSGTKKNSTNRRILLLRSVSMRKEPFPTRPCSSFLDRSRWTVSQKTRKPESHCIPTAL